MMLPRLCPADLGRRVSLRALHDDGTAFDTVGPLTGWRSGSLTVEGRRGPVELGWGPTPSAGLPTVVAGRVVPPEISAVDLLAVAQQGWPPTESHHLAGWELRWTGEDDPRADSVRVATDPGPHLDDTLAAVTAWYAERGRKPALQVPAEWLADELSRRQWTINRRIVMMTAHSDTVAAVGPSPGSDSDGPIGQPGIALSLTDRARSMWIEAHEEFEPSAEYVERMHRPATLVFASAIDSATGQVVGTGRASVHAGWGGITSVRTVTGWQRRGVARTITQALAAWTSQRGAKQCYLQVVEENSPALALYASLGFTAHHRYVYWIPPA